MGNVERMAHLRRGLARPGPVLACGASVREVGRLRRRGVIDAIFADYQAAVDSFAVPNGWYEMQVEPPRTSKDDYWYSVILEEGAILAGDKDLVLDGDAPHWSER